MGGGDNGWDSGLLGATSNNLVTFPKQDSICPSCSHAPSPGNVTIMCVYACVCMHVCIHVCVCVCVRVCACVHDHACLLATNLCEFSPQTNVVDFGGFCPIIGGEVHEEARHRVKP